MKNLKSLFRGSLFLTILLYSAVAFAQSTIPSIPKEPILAGTLPKAATVVMSTALVLGGISFFLQPLYYILAALPLLFYRKSDSGWGVVYNSITKLPVPNAKVTLFKTYRGNKKFKDVQKSTSGGRFGFIVEPGEYYIEVKASNYIFPSKKISGQDPYFKHPYHGEPIIKVGKDQLIDLNIPVDPYLGAKPPVISLIKTFFEKIRISILIVGTAFSLYLAILFPQFYNFTFLLIYVVIWVVEFVNYSRKSHACKVIQASDKVPVTNALIKIYNEKNRLDKTLMTDPFGQFLPILEPGNYRMEISHDNFAKTEAKLHVDKNGLTKSTIISLSKLKRSN